jgi:hypothetical protein
MGEDTLKARFSNLFFHVVYFFGLMLPALSKAAFKFLFLHKF